VLDGTADPQGNEQFSGVVRAIQMHWQFSLQRSLQRRCKRDLSIANNVMQQKESFSMPGERK